jgi:PAS domain S-box-containing protein
VQRAIATAGSLVLLALLLPPASCPAAPAEDIRISVWYWVAVAAFALAAMTAITIQVVRLNRSLRVSREEREASRSGLEVQVQQRTADLEKRHEELRREVNQRNHAELDSHQAREEWELTFNSIPDLIAILGTDYRITKVNRSLAARLGTSPEALVGEPCFLRICGAEESPANCPHRQTLADGIEHSIEMHIERLGGDFLVTTSPLNDATGRRVGVVHLCRDITAAVRAGQEREEARQFLQAVIDGVNEEIMVIAPDHRVVLMNHAVRDVSTPDASCHRVSHDREEPCAGEHPCPLQIVLDTKKSATVTHTHRRRDGVAFQVEIQASPIFDTRGDVMYIVEACRDVTEKLALEALQRTMQERVFEEQRELSIATLAGGIAHDFNNILMGVIGNAELLAAIAPAADKQRGRIDTIIELSKRMAHLTRQLLAYSRQGAYEHTVLALNGAVSEAVALTHRGPASAVEVSMSLQQGLWPVIADPGQVTQVLASLLANAFEAMEAGGGRLTVVTENFPGKAAWECGLKHHHPGGDYVRVRMTDTGHGIPAEIQARIFDPFFTTRFVGRGLGLSAALGIVRSHGGCIAVESAPGLGATFDVYLPRHAAPAEAPEPRPRPTARPARKILVVEDEAAVLALLQTMLAELGFASIPAESGAKALALFTAEREDVALAILDVKLEGMDGKQLARELKTIDPGIKVLISSGYDEQTALSGLEKRDYDDFIHKPYWLDDLRARLQMLLGS